MRNNPANSTTTSKTGHSDRPTNRSNIPAGSAASSNNATGSKSAST